MSSRRSLEYHPRGFWRGIDGDNGKEIAFANVFRCKMMFFLGRMIVLGVEKQKDDN